MSNCYPHPQTRRTTRNRVLLLNLWMQAMRLELHLRDRYGPLVIHIGTYDRAVERRRRRWGRFSRYVDALGRIV
jgi:hypothetical protein